MTIDDLVKLLDALTKLIGVLAWPVLIAIILIRFAPSLSGFFENLSKLTLKGAGWEASAERQAAEAAAALVAAGVANADPAAKPQPAQAAAEARQAVQAVSDAVTPRVLRRASRATILWVDDKSDKTDYERQSLEALGIRFVLATTTDEALALARSNTFDVVITDLSRPPDTRAGYTLLTGLRDAGRLTPVILYSQLNTHASRDEARNAGFFASTNRAAELFTHVLDALRTKG